MKLKRNYLTSWFGFKRSTFEKTIKPRWFSGNGLPSIYQGWFGNQNTHYVIETDYDNYGLVYGCDQWFGFMWVEFATLLGREKFLEYPYVRAAKDKLDIVGYSYDLSWVKPGLDCGFDAAKTLDEVMVDKFMSQPDWA
jgi:hypothetical protein